MSLSSVKSESALRSRLFSSSRSFSRFTCSVFRSLRDRRPDNTTLVATTRLDPDRRYRGAAQLFDQFGPAGGVIARRTLLVGQHRDVQTILRHVDTPEREHCHLRIPSSFMPARPHPTSRLSNNRLP